jgi:hypothetical protein
MTNEEIKAYCEAQYKALREAEMRLRILRAACPHSETHEGNWSWRIGCIEPATICSICGTLIKINSLPVMGIITTTY